MQIYIFNVSENKKILNSLKLEFNGRLSISICLFHDTILQI